MSAAFSGTNIAAHGDMRLTPHVAGTISLGAVLGAGALLWSDRVPQSAMTIALGLPGPSAAAGDRHCGASRRLHVWNAYPPRWVTCRGPYDPARPFDRVRIVFDRWAQDVDYVSVEWMLEDSVAWVHAVDSLHRTLVARGGQRLECGPPNPHIPYIRAESFWRFVGFDVRLVAYRSELLPAGTPLWELQLAALRGGAPECGGHWRGLSN